MSYNHFIDNAPTIRLGQENITINADSMGVECPNNDKQLWDMHPRIFLRFNGQSVISCPYCGCQYHRRSD